MLTREVPFFRIILPFCAGIICGLYFNPGYIFFTVAAIILTILFCLSIGFNKSLTNILYGITFSVSLFYAGLLLHTLEKNKISTLENKESVLYGLLSEYPEETENSYRLIVMLNGLLKKDALKKINGSIMLYYRKGSDMDSFVPGDELVIKCTPVEITSRGNPYEFDYKFYMQNQGINYYAFTDSSDILIHRKPQHRKLIHRALIIREKIIGMYRERGLKGERLALVAAITLGQKNMLEPEQKQYFIKAGVMHIMAVSGLHAVILSMFIINLLFFMKGRFHSLKIIVVIFLLWAFAFITGLTPSVLRASIMFTFVQAGSLMKRPVNNVNSVLASAFIILIAKPTSIFDAGFLLSYSAVIYIISFYHELYTKISIRKKIPDLVWQSAAVTLIAQAGTLPLTILMFNRFPTWFVISNILIVPLSSLIIITGSLIPLTFYIPFISLFLAKSLDKLTWLTEFLTKKAASLPLSTIENIGITTTGCILLTITIFLLLSFIFKKGIKTVLFPLTAILIFFASGTVREIRNRTSNELIVYNSIVGTDIGIRTGKILRIYSDTIIPGPEATRHYASQNLKLVIHTYPVSGAILEAGGNRILVADHIGNQKLEDKKLDYIILTGRNPVADRNKVSAYSCKKLILTTEDSYYSLPVSINAEEVIYIKKQGAFRTVLQTTHK